MSRTEDIYLQTQVDLYLDSLIRDLPSEDDLAKQQTFSARFEKRMARLLHMSRGLLGKYDAKAQTVSFGDWKRRRTIRRRLLVAAILMGLVIAMVGYALSSHSIKVFDLEINADYPDTYNLIVREAFINNIKIDRAEAMAMAALELPSYIPEGYVEVERELTPFEFSVRYENNAGSSIGLRKTYLGNASPTISHDYRREEGIEVNGYAGFYSYMWLFDNSTMYWPDDLYLYSLYSGEGLSKAEMLKIANSIEGLDE